MLINVENVTKSFLDDIILENVSLTVNEGDRIGLLGVNGAGKTTLLNVIIGALTQDSGVVAHARGLSIGYLRQNDALDSERTLEEEAKETFAKVYALQKMAAQCAKKLEENPNDEELLANYGQLTAQFEALGGYELDSKIKRVLNGLGFGSFAKNTLVRTLSGGEKMRFGIAKMLLQEPGVLILDEPTNHLDFSMLRWLEEYLESYKGAVLVVSHDRYFLDAVAKDICEVERTKLTRYKGGYSSFVSQKAERRRNAMKEWQKQQEEIAKLEEFVRKNLAKSASIAGVGTRVKALEKMQRLEKPAGDFKGISLKFSYDVEPFTTVLKCEDLGISIGEGAEKRVLFSGIELEVMRGEKVALVGMNGVGKSTFLKAVQNLIAHKGRVQWGGNVKVGYFDQELAGLEMHLTVLEAVHSRYPTKTEFEIRSALGRLLLEGEDVYKKVKELSGANRAKLAFVILQMQRTNVLLLDEPTNHLDYKAKEELENALRTYTGTLIAVSHDRYFLRKVPGRILEMRADGFSEYNGNYDYYLEKSSLAAAKQAGEERAEKEQKKQITQETGYRSKLKRAEDSKRRVHINALEKEMLCLEKEIEQANKALSMPENTSDFEKLSEISKALQKSNAALDMAMEKWLTLTED